LSLSEYGITILETGKLEKFATEEAFYKRLGLQYIPPEIREGGEEIERAARGTVPRLLEPSHIKGDLHIHSDWSDGRDTIEAMVLAAKALGYEYVGISDHSGGRGIARGLNRARLKEQMAEIKALNERMGGVRILTSLEVDIRSDGTLDMPDEVLKELDIVTASVHSGMNQTQEPMTRRIIKAMENPNVDVLGHPTGRLMPDREPVAVDMEAIFQAAVRTRTMLEINAMPSRLDLKDTHVYRARELGIKLVISTDAHSTEHLGFMRFGVGVARRGWCEAKDILNTKPLAELLKYLKSRGKR
jgi:DNA polymerase (family 10)